MGTRLFVGNLSYEVTQDVLQKIFSEAGKVIFSKVITDRMTGRSKGFGFVEMSSEAEVEEAVKNLDGRECMGRAIRVSEARDFEEGGAPRFRTERKPFGAGPSGGNGGRDRFEKREGFGRSSSFSKKY